MSDFLNEQLSSHGATAAADAVKHLAAFVPESSYVGELLKLDYGSAEVLVHDFQRQATGGLPLGSFALASRIASVGPTDPLQEDASLILLRVTGVSKLPNALEMDFSRFEAGKRASDTEEPWDATGKTDQYTLHQLRFSGVHCRVLGTYLMRQRAGGAWYLAFGSDISNFYSGRGLKVYKPSADALRAIANFPRPELDDSHPLSNRRVKIGRVRYASSERSAEQEVPVELVPADLIARRTALFGMSRTGKSNTTKMIASAVFRLRGEDRNVGRVGQLIFDVNGEYANDNPQDGGCLRNVIHTIPDVPPEDVVTYGQAPHPNDPNRRIIKVNFFGADPTRPRDWGDADEVRRVLEPLLVGKQEIDALLGKETAKYLKAFRDTSLEPPEDLNRSNIVRYRRALVAYRTILAAAGFRAPQALRTASITGLFSAQLVTSLSQGVGDRAADYQSAAVILAQPNPSWDQMRSAMGALRAFIGDANGGYQAFNAAYQQRSTEGSSWHDDRLTGLLAILEYPTGVRTFRSLTTVHDPNSSADFAEEIATELSAGRLVIVDQSIGEPDINRAAAERIMWAVFNRQKAAFVSPSMEGGQVRRLPDVIVYAEEAHNLLPANTADLRNIWSRVAKEGSKYRIGLVYATQEPSSLQSNILKNTDNWFVAHLNNTDEVKELRKYYDFADFAESIVQATDPGFVRMRSLSNPYIVPVQVDRFRAPSGGNAVSQ